MLAWAWYVNLCMVCQHVVTSMRPMNAYKDMLDNVVSPITCVNMNHQNQLEQMEKGAMFATIAFSSVYNLISLASLDVTFLRLWTL
jgi:uncharacterized protein YjaG (DUF416 family)